MAEQITLSELNNLIKDSLLEAFPESLWIIAEISELKENRTGHCYLELIEKDSASDEILARSRATIWSYTYRMLKPYFETSTGKSFSSGIKILIRATVEYHEAFGLSLNIKDIDPTYTIGDLSLKKKEIIERLQTEGIFEMNKELELPLVPQNIAIISSATAAGYQDFVEQLESNPYGFQYYHTLFEAFMQGSEAAPSIIAALEQIFEMEDKFDVVVIIRGGGAQADLSCFDDYELAYFVTQFPLPIITGIGHEKDETITDLVAHTKMKTPTAVAEFLISGVAGFYEHILGIESAIIVKTREILETHNRFLEGIASGINTGGKFFLSEKNAQLNNTMHRFRANTDQFVYRNEKRIAEIENTLVYKTKSCLLNMQNKLSHIATELGYGIGHFLQEEQNSLSKVCMIVKNKLGNFFSNEEYRLALDERAIQLLDPKKILERGYTLTLKDGAIIKSKKGLQPGDEIETVFVDGKTKSTIEKQ